MSLFSDTRATSSVDSRRLWSELGIRIVELTVYITSQENRVRVLRSVSSLVAHKKVPPDAYFILGNFCIFLVQLSFLSFTRYNFFFKYKLLCVQLNISPSPLNNLIFFFTGALITFILLDLIQISIKYVFFLQYKCKFSNDY